MQLHFEEETVTETDGSFHLAIFLRHVLPLKRSPVAEMDFKKSIHEADREMHCYFQNRAQHLQISFRQRLVASRLALYKFLGVLLAADI